MSPERSLYQQMRASELDAVAAVVAAAAVSLTLMWTF